MTQTTNYDVVIVGAGVAGAVIAKQLGTQGKRVLILESGMQNPLDRAPFVGAFFNAASKMPESPYPAYPVDNRFDPTTQCAPRATTLDLLNTTDPKTGYLVQNTSPLPFNSTYERLAGGTTWHWMGTCLRMLPNDFTTRTSYGMGVDWPIPYADMLPLYALAEQEMAVACTTSTQVYMDGILPSDYVYPQPGIVTSVVDQRVSEADGLVVAQGTVQVAPTPQARNSTPQQDRRTCAGNTNCIPICPIQAKYDATVTLEDALQTANVTILYQTVATNVATDGNGRVTGIDYLSWNTVNGIEGKTGSGTVTGTIFVLAAHAIETPKLLLMSNNGQGVANSSDQVGRNLMDHVIYLSWALAKEPLYGYRGPLSTSGIESLRDGAFRKDYPSFRIEIGNEGWNFPTGDPYTSTNSLLNGWPLASTDGSVVLNKEGQTDWGLSLSERMNHILTRQFRFAFLLEQDPEASNRVTLSATYKDGLGLPRPQIHYDISEYTRKGFVQAKETSSAIYAKMGATEFTTFVDGTTSKFEYEGQNFNFFGAGHIMGTCRMGSSPTDSVVKASGQSWDLENLYIVGSSTFPTVGTANPTLTIVALAFNTANVISAALT